LLSDRDKKDAIAFIKYELCQHLLRVSLCMSKAISYLPIGKTQPLLISVPSHFHYFF